MNDNSKGEALSGLGGSSSNVDKKMSMRKKDDPWQDVDSRWTAGIGR